jgi:hypothetical protein
VYYVSDLYSGRLNGSKHTKDLDKQVDRFQVRKFVVIRVNAHAKEEASIATVYNLVIPELRRTR